MTLADNILMMFNGLNAFFKLLAFALKLIKTLVPSLRQLLITTKIPSAAPGRILMLALFLCLPNWGWTQASGDIYFRFNQLGYEPTNFKTVVILSNHNLANKSLNIRDANSKALVMSIKLSSTSTKFSNFQFFYEIDFSILTQSGRYFFAIDNHTSAPFSVDENIYTAVVPTTLKFFAVQRCGQHRALYHNQCHLNLSQAVGGPLSGRLIDTSGGWHDAGDYLKFVITTSFTSYLQLLSVESLNEPTASPMFQEALVGLEWLSKMYHQPSKTIFYQVGDRSDHSSWRLPEQDDHSNARRKVFASQADRGANLAGKMAASFALGAQLLRHSSEFEKYLNLAISVYAEGKRRPQTQSTTDGFYQESSWLEDMALGAIELYRLTGNNTYLNDAKRYAQAAGSNKVLDYDNIHALAHYRVGETDANYREKAIEYLRSDLLTYQNLADRNPFQAAVYSFYWGSTTPIMGVALTALFYEKLTESSEFRRLAEAQRDYIFGKNQWGVSFVTGLGHKYALFPHHQIADIKKIRLDGFWNAGPVARSTWQAYKINIPHDPLAIFQSGEAVFHDHKVDYVTNEPTLTAAALGISMISSFMNIKQLSRVLASQ